MYDVLLLFDKVLVTLSKRGKRCFLSEPKKTIKKDKTNIQPTTTITFF
jgi:hypothetical protein